MNDRDPNTRRDGEELQAPTKLVAALKELPARRVFVPPAIDDAVLRAARRHFSAKPGVRTQIMAMLRAWFARPAFAIAAACLLALGTFWILHRRGHAPEFAREDLNHDGQVDILDAFQLAREAGAGTVSESHLDLNGDGTVDGRDAAVIAAHAVKLGKGRS